MILSQTKGNFFGYSNISRAYRVFNKKILMVEEFVHVVFNETITTLSLNDLIEENIIEHETKNLGLEDNLEVRRNLPRECRFSYSHSKEKSWEIYR